MTLNVYGMLHYKLKASSCIFATIKLSSYLHISKLLHNVLRRFFFHVQLSNLPNVLRRFCCHARLWNLNKFPVMRSYQICAIFCCHVLLWNLQNVLRRFAVMRSFKICATFCCHAQLWNLCNVLHNSSVMCSNQIQVWIQRF